jgi:hypothetical protein
MKLSAVFVTMAMAATEPQSQNDCPNESWVFTVGDNGNYCRATGVQISCDYRQMEVVFNANHLYGTPDEDQFGLESMTAFLNDSGCDTKSDSDGNYKISFKLDKCGTTVTQADGQIVFRNRIEGNSAASTVSGVVMTSLLGLDVSCVYGDNFELLVDDMYINIDDVDTGDDEDDNGQTSDGDFSQYFSIKAYRNDDYSSEITEANRVNLGSSVYLEITENKAIPNNIDYYLTDCTGYQDIDDPSTYSDASHAIADNMCYSELVNGSKTTPYAGGQSDGHLRATFSSFTFAGNTDENVDIQCRVQLCAMDVNGDKLDAACAGNRQCPANYMNTCSDPDCVAV